MVYTFTDDCIIGITQIDEEHRGLFRLIGELHDMLGEDFSKDRYDEICEIVERLKQYTVEHFRHEETYMEAIDHPELEQQRQQHKEFCQKIEEMDIRSGESDQYGLVTDLLTYLVRWLYRHIIGSDLLIGKLVTVKEWKKQDDCAFREEYLTGVEQIDEEHRELLRMLGEIHHMIARDDAADKHAEIVDRLKTLHIYVRTHFKDEEDYMESIRFDGLDVHRLAHDALATRLELMDHDEFYSMSGDELAGFVEFMTEWIATHIVQMDRHISAN